MMLYSEEFGHIMKHNGEDITLDIKTLCSILKDEFWLYLKFSQRCISDDDLTLCIEYVVGDDVIFGIYIDTVYDGETNVAEVKSITLSSNMYDNMNPMGCKAVINKYTCSYKDAINRYTYDFDTNEYTDLNDESLTIEAVDSKGNMNWYKVNKFRWHDIVVRATNKLNSWVRKRADKINNNKRKDIVDCKLTAVLDGVTEYDEGYPVELITDEKTGRLCVVAYNESHYNNVSIDAEQLYEALKTYFEK